MKVIILMAGIGSRLGNPFPKCLTPLRPGLTILDHQLENLAQFAGSIVAVVGFKKDIVLEHRPELLYAYNPRYDQTNTSQSLLTALRHFPVEDVLFLNGDVVFDPRIVPAMLACPNSCMATVAGRVGEEEIKYALDANGCITSVSKTVPNPVGEAIGINLLRARDLDLIVRSLEACRPGDYFERGLEIAVAEGLVLSAVDVTHLPCIEVDFAEDLARAKTLIAQ